MLPHWSKTSSTNSDFIAPRVAQQVRSADMRPLGAWTHYVFVHRFFMHHITLHCMLWFSALTPCLLTAMASETPPDGVGSAFQSSDLDEPMTKIGFSNDVRAKLLEDNFCHHHLP
jgi:hypothetical protein